MVLQSAVLEILHGIRAARSVTILLQQRLGDGAAKQRSAVVGFPEGEKRIAKRVPRLPEPQLPGRATTRGGRKVTIRRDLGSQRRGADAAACKHEPHPLKVLHRLATVDERVC